MPRRFLLEKVYTTAEYDPRYPAPLRAVGVLLDAVIDGPPPAPDLDGLLRQLESRPQLATCH